jgi:hypothetical protein
VLSVQSEIDIVKTAITQSSAVAKQAQVDNVPLCSCQLPLLHALLCNSTVMHAAACASSIDIYAESKRRRVQACWCTRFDELLIVMQADWAQDNAKSTDEEMGQVNTRSNKAMRRCTTVAI